MDAHYGAAPVPAVSHKTELRLAEKLTADGTLAGRAIDELVDFVVESLDVAEDLGVTEVNAFATSAIRESNNVDKVLKKVKARTGVDIELLSGEEEARLTFLAVRRWFGWSVGRLLVVDIGGGSLELATGTDEDPDVAVSLPLGAGRLTRQWLTSDPPDAGEVKSLRKHVRAEIGAAAGQLRRVGPVGRAVATSKTLRQLARIGGAAPSSEGPMVPRLLFRDELRMWTAKLAEMTSAERADLPGVSAGRAEQLVAGAEVALAAMDLLELPELVVCPWALREGVILNRLDQIGA